MRHFVLFCSDDESRQQITNERTNERRREGDVYERETEADFINFGLRFDYHIPCTIQFSAPVQVRMDANAVTVVYKLIGSIRGGRLPLPRCAAAHGMVGQKWGLGRVP